MRPHWSRLAVEVFLFIISHFFNIVKWPSLHRRTHTPFFKYNIIFFYVSQVAAFTSPLFWYRTDCLGPRFDASEASIKNVEWMAIWCLEDDVPRFQPAWANRTLAYATPPWARWAACEPFWRAQPFLTSLRAISGLECTHKGHMDSTEKLPYVVPSGNSGRHARARPAKTSQEY